LRRWHRRLVVQAPRPIAPGKRLGRPPVASQIEQLVLQMATENPRWGYRRIQGALSNLGHDIHNTTVRNVLRRHHIDPAPIRSKSGMSWSQFVKLRWEVLEITDFWGSCRSTIAQYGTSVIKLSQSLGGRRFQLASGIRHGAMKVLLLVAQAFFVSWRRCWADLVRQDLGVLSKPQPERGGQSPRLCLLSSRPDRDRPQVQAIDQQRSPPLTWTLEHRVILLCSHDSKSMPTLRCVMISNDQNEGHHAFDQHQPRTIQSHSDRVAA
jgi:hypothetical protein